jgi:ABC-type lipoprotein release transport system permease subunit
MKSELKAFGVERSALRIKVPAVVMSERESLGITLVGIDPEEEKGLSFIGDDVVRGRHLESSSDKGLIIGAKLASRLQTRVGKRVVILATDKQNKIADRGFKVVGVYEDALEATEMQFVFVGRLVAQQMLKMKGQASEASLLFEDQDNLEGPLSRISENFADLDVADWKTLQPLARIVTEVQNGFLWIWFLVVIVAVGFSLVNTLFMAIFERIREIGLLLALGMRPGYIVVQVMFESWFILLIALVAGNSMGILGVCWLSGGIDLSSFSAGAEMAQFGRVFYPTLWSSDLVMANFLLLIVCSVASLYPAIKASRYIPVEAITRA